MNYEKIKKDTKICIDNPSPGSVLNEMLNPVLVIIDKIDDYIYFISDKINYTRNEWTWDIDKIRCLSSEDFKKMVFYDTRNEPWCSYLGICHYWVYDEIVNKRKIDLEKIRSEGEQLKENKIINLKDIIKEHNTIIDNIIGIEDDINKVSKILIECINTNNKIFICGNGGSASQAEHFTAELIGRFKKEDCNYPCICLNSNISVITSLSNDYSYDDIFSKQIKALGSKDDILIGISTSGNSKNIQKAIVEANNKNMITISLLGNKGGDQRKVSRYNMIISSDKTERIQEAHIFILHYLAELLEKI